MSRNKIAKSRNGGIMIAVDVVLLPPVEVMDRAIEINGQLLGTSGSDIVLDREKCLPHITLAMGCMNEDDLGKVNEILAGIAGSFPPLSLKTVSSKGGKAWIKIEKTRDIEVLHEIVMIRLSSFFSYKAARDMVFEEEGEEVNDLTLDYIKKFFTDSSFENYAPHITVGKGDMDVEVETFDFVSAELALCHLGNYCTCRKVLLSHRLSA